FEATSEPNKTGVKNANCVQKRIQTEQEEAEKLIACDDVFLSPAEREYKQFLIENQKRIDTASKEARIEREKEIAEKTNYDGYIYYPHDLEGKYIERDAQCFEVLEAWPSLPDSLKSAIVSIVRSAAVSPVLSETDSRDENTTNPQPTQDAASAQNSIVADKRNFPTNDHTTQLKANTDAKEVAQ
ncbi:hypothetical protein P4E94_19050, partial [Pontiellaceae bacterium B12219]|nr:hypothetical protein [Pontiellaceae bacterium B12219]